MQWIRPNLDQRRGKNSKSLLEDADLGKGEALPISALPELTKRDDKRS